MLDQLDIVRIQSLKGDYNIRTTSDVLSFESFHRKFHGSIWYLVDPEINPKQIYILLWNPPSFCRNILAKRKVSVPAVARSLLFLLWQKACHCFLVTKPGNENPETGIKSLYNKTKCSWKVASILVQLSSSDIISSSMQKFLCGASKIDRHFFRHCFSNFPGKRCVFVY